MPVDLSAIPDVAQRKRPPLLKRWLVVLLFFLIAGGFLTFWRWPANAPVQGGMFWHCLISIPLAVWIVAFGVRWLSWLAGEWPAEGWDNAREQDIANEIQRGQRFLALGGMSVHLPHAVTSGVLTQQFLLPRGITLPAVVDTPSQAVSYQVAFSDVGQSPCQRVSRRLKALLEDSAIRRALSQRYIVCPLTVVIQSGDDSLLSTEDRESIKNSISPLLPVSARVNFLAHFGLAEIDNWLDDPGSIEALLILSVNLPAVISAGEGEAAVALLLHFGKDECDDFSIARIHRPEQSSKMTTLHTSAMQALQWGKTRTEDVAGLWLAGMGTENKAQALLANNNLIFPRVEENAPLTDIDLKSGYTGAVSPWLAIALAAGSVGKAPSPQLIMSMPEKSALPWWLIVHPVPAS